MKGLAGLASPAQTYIVVDGLKGKLGLLGGIKKETLNFPRDRWEPSVSIKDTISERGAAGIYYHVIMTLFFSWNIRVHVHTSQGTRPKEKALSSLPSLEKKDMMNAPLSDLASLACTEVETILEECLT